MTFRVLFSCSLLALGFLPLNAADEAHRDAIQELIKATHQKEQYEASTTSAISKSLSQMEAQIPEEKREAFGRAVERILELMKTEFGWDTMEEEIIEAYAETLSLEEIQAVMPLVKDEAMQNYLKKSTGMGEKIAEISEQKTLNLKPKILEIVQEEMSR